MYPSNFFTVIIITVAIMCFGKYAFADTTSLDTRLAVSCAKASDEEKYRIEFNTNNDPPIIYVSLIADRGEGDYIPIPPGVIHTISDLNNDGLQDVITKNYMRGVDMDEIQVYAGYANCGKGVYFEFGVGFFSDIVQLKRKKNQRWPDFRVTRKCDNRDENHPRLQTRTFTIKFDEKNFKYGPPNNDPELMDFCSEKELSLPFESE